MSAQELQRQRSFAYYDKNRIAINERVRLKRLNTRLSVDGIRPIAQFNITKKEILTLIGIKALTLDKIGGKKMKYPLPNENARCLGSNCDKKENCSRYLSIEIDTQDYMWHMDAKKELKELECTLFIDWRNAHEFEQ